MAMVISILLPDKSSTALVHPHSWPGFMLILCLVELLLRMFQATLYMLSRPDQLINMTSAPPIFQKQGCRNDLGGWGVRPREWAVEPGSPCRCRICKPGSLFAEISWPRLQCFVQKTAPAPFPNSLTVTLCKIAFVIILIFLRVRVARI